MRYKQALGLLALVLLAVGIASSLHDHRPSLKERIRATAARLKDWPMSMTIPKGYEQDLIALAKEPTADLAEAFRSLDEERSKEADEAWDSLDKPSSLDKALRWLGVKQSPFRGSRPFDDRVWVTGNLLTILAFNCPPITDRDWPTWGSLKSGLVEDANYHKQNPAEDNKLAEWPWSSDHGTWHLQSIDSYLSGSSDGRISPLFDYYKAHFKRRSLP